MEFSETFYTFVITSAVGVCVLSIRMMYKSKCKKVNMCGVAFERDLEIEMKEDLAEMAKHDKHETI